MLMKEDGRLIVILDPKLGFYMVLRKRGLRLTAETIAAYISWRS